MEVSQVNPTVARVNRVMLVAEMTASIVIALAHSELQKRPPNYGPTCQMKCRLFRQIEYRFSR
jgi:hypothetical protein